MFLISVFICFCIASAVNFFRTRKQRAHIKNLKGPFTFPLMGSLHKLILLTPKNFAKKSQHYVQKFGAFSRCWIFHRLLIPTADYEFVEQLLKSESHLNTGYNLLKPWLGNNGLLMIDGAQWHQRRQLISHGAFGKKALEDFLRTFEMHSKTLVERLRDVADGQQTFDIGEYVSNAILDTMIESSLGIQGRAQCEVSTDYAKWITELTTHFTEKFLRLSSANAATYAIMCPFQRRKQKRLIKSVRQFTQAIIDERRTSKLSNFQIADKNAPKKPLQDIFIIEMANGIPALAGAQKTLAINFLDILLAATIDQRALSDCEIHDELNTFLYQGYLLTTSALSFALVNLARHPAVQSKVFEEIKQQRQQNPNTSPIELLDQLQYLECVIKETLRLYPALPIIGRELTQPFEYVHSIVGNGTLPVGSEIYINIFEMLRCGAKFQQPLKFKPERFESETKNALEIEKNLLYFRMGPRNCIARKFAILMLKSFLTQILSEFEILPFGDEVRLEFKIVLKSSNGFQIGLQAR